MMAFFLTQWPNPDPVSVPVAQPFKIRVCDFAEPTGRFVNQRVEVEATVTMNFHMDRLSPPHYVLHPIKYCRPSDSFIFADLDLENYRGRNSDLSRLFQRELLGYEIDLKITGTLILLPPSNQNYLFYYRVVPDDIEIISQWRKFEPKGAA
jgi:hypothetical protein